MKNINEDLINTEMNELQDEFDEMLLDAEKMLGYKIEGLNDTINELIYLNTKESKELANDILDVQDEISKMAETFTYKNEEDPFSTLYDEDNEF